MKKTTTRGGVVIENIKVGDIHYEYEYGFGIKCEVITLPTSNVEDDGDIFWTWKSKNLQTGEIINYGVNDKYSHYGPNLYDYEAYIGSRYI